ncbi:MAG TPA: hypothetical protein VML96_07725, partial [Egibacteraceae bacterium]|nr:hypothetical protein [Egibacteraceae bacterium]
VVYTTHYLHELEVLDASIAVIERGRLAARGPRGELVARYGETALVLTFDGPAPQLPVGLAVDARVEAPDPAGSTIRIPSPDPARMAVELLAALGEHRARLRSLEISRPDLESAYLALTGRQSAAAEREEFADAVA